MKPSKNVWLLLAAAVCGCGMPDRMQPSNSMAMYYDNAGQPHMAMVASPAPQHRRGLLEVAWQRYQNRMNQQMPADGGASPMVCQNGVMYQPMSPNGMVCQNGSCSACMQQGSAMQPQTFYQMRQREHRLLDALLQRQPQRLTPMPTTVTMHSTMTSPAAQISEASGIQPVAHHVAADSPEVLPQTLSQIPESSHAVADSEAGKAGWTPVGPNLFMGTGKMEEASSDAPPVLSAMKQGGTSQPTMAATPSQAADAMPPGPPLRVVSGRSIRMNYKLKDVGPSGVSSVELWFTQDGRKWQKADQSLPPQPPYTLNVKEDGLYGFTLLARNGLGVSKNPPMVGDAPQVWVDVDTMPPSVQLGEIKFGVSAQTRQLMVNWKVSDKNLATKPVTLSYAEKPEGPWMPIAANIDNTGTYLWQMPGQLPSRFLVRVEAVDTVGNVASACSREPIVMDLSQPSVCILSVEATRKK